MSIQNEKIDINFVIEFAGILFSELRKSMSLSDFKTICALNSSASNFGLIIPSAVCNVSELLEKATGLFIEKNPTASNEIPSLREEAILMLKKLLSERAALYAQLQVG
jgi:hypothetical protein